MASSAQHKSKYSRRIKVLGIGVILFALLYSGAWFWGASRLKTELIASIAEVRQSGKTADCANLDIRGFPFRVGIFCDKIAFQDSLQQISVRLGAFRSAAQIYNPTQAIVELDGPLELALPGGDSLSASWSLLHASAKIARPIPKRISVEGKDLSFALRSRSTEKVVKMQNAELHFRTVNEDVDLAVSVLGMLVDPAIADGRVIPEFDLNADVQIKNGVALAATTERDVRKLLLAQSGEIRVIRLQFTKGGGFQLSGPIKINDEGFIDADLSLSFSEANKLGKTIQDISPEIASYVRPSLSLAASTAQPGEDPRIEITIRKGRAAIGIIPVGRIPPLQ